MRILKNWLQEQARRTLARLPITRLISDYCPGDRSTGADRARLRVWRGAREFNESSYRTVFQDLRLERKNVSFDKYPAQAALD
ncbi:hypothetical protein ACMAZH_13345 [Arenicellales bacterium nBUS_45]